MNEASPKLVSVTASFSFSLRDQIRSLAKRQKKTVAELVRPWLLDAAGIRSPGTGENLPDGKPRLFLTIRIPSDTKEAFARVAKSHGTTVAGIVAAIIVEAMKNQIEAAD